MPRPQSVHNKLENQENKQPLSTNESQLGSKSNSTGRNSPSISMLNNSTSNKIQMFQDGRIKNVPSNMLLDQFGMIGILACIKANDKDKDLYTLALGFDLTALGLNLNSNE